MNNGRTLNNLIFYCKEVWEFVEASIVTTFALALAILITAASITVVAVPIVLVLKLLFWLWKIL